MKSGLIDRLGTNKNFIAYWSQTDGPLQTSLLFSRISNFPERYVQKHDVL